MDIRELIIKAGGASAVGRKCGSISSQAVSQWQKIPAKHVLTVADASGIPCWNIRPDLYPPERFKKSA